MARPAAIVLAELREVGLDMRLGSAVAATEDTDTDGALLEALVAELSETEAIVAGLRGTRFGSEDRVAYLLVATPTRALFIERHCPGPRLAYLPACTTASSVPLREVLNVSVQTYLDSYEVSLAVQRAGSCREAVLHASFNNLGRNGGEFILQVARFVGAGEALARVANGRSAGSAPRA